jgi:predicted RNA-binding Zn-ribbon protein involved in translation (DUF1610 family)
MVTIVRDTEAIKNALHAGQLTVPDTSTGYHRSMYADCPSCGQSAGIRRIVREHGGEITGVTMYCPRCAKEFTASVDSLYLK